MNPENPVVKLCQAGMQAEAQGKIHEARRLFLEAWDARKNDFDACIAAHYVARLQETPAEMLTWNRKALEHAQAADEAEVQGFFASLYLNLGWSHESLGQKDLARASYEAAAVHLGRLPSGPYRDVVAGGIAAGQQRTAQETPTFSAD